MGEAHNKRELRAMMKRGLDLYKGRHWPNMDVEQKYARIVINYVMHVIETRVHSITFRYPRFVIEAATEDAMNQEPIAEAWVKYSWKKGRVQDELRRQAKDKEIFGTGVALTGWLFETDEGTIDETGEKGPRKVRRDQFFARRIHPGNFLLSPECGRSLQDAQYCGYWELVPLTEVKQNAHFSNTRNLKGNAENLRSFLDKKLEPDEIPADVKRVKLYHYYEKARRIHVIMCPETEKPLYAEEWTWESGKYPFHVLQGPGDEDSFYAMSMAEQLMHPQREINEARAQLSDYRRTNQTKYQCGPGVITPKGDAALKSSDPNALVEHNSETPGAIVPLQRLPIQPEVYETEQRALQDMQAIGAVDQYQLGNAPTKRTPTAEVHAISSTGGARAQNDRQAFETLCAEVAEDCIAWGKQNAVKVVQLPIFQKGTKVPLWQGFTKEDISGEFSVSVAVNSTTPPNDADRLQSIAFFIQSVNPLIQLLPLAAQAGINLLPLLKQVLKALPDIEDVDEILQGMNQMGAAAPPTGMPGLPPGSAAPGAPAQGPFVSPLFAPSSVDTLLAALGGR
jgi:hypothetical protein